jgi:site-specific recombinase XerD
VNAEGLAPVYMRFTIDAQRIEFSIQRFIKPEFWSASAQKMKGSYEEARVFNQFLRAMEQRTYDAHRQLLELRQPITVHALKDKLFGTEVKEETRTIVPIFKEHNRRIEALINKEYAPGTLERYTTSLKHTVEFMQWQYKVDDMDITKINHQFVANYDFFLRSEKNCCNNTTVKYLKNFKKIIRICMANGWIAKDPFLALKSKLTEVVPAFLTSEELALLSGKVFNIPRIAQVRDIFLFSCYTGLAYVDVKKLDRSEITIGVDGGQWVTTYRQKTDTPSRIPLLPMAIEIMDRYADFPACKKQGKLLPVLSNQKMNAYLREIGDLCGIEKPFTYHTARHTFATTVTLANGVPIESVSKMLGHKNIKTTQHYARILDMKVSQDMNDLRIKLAGVSNKSGNHRQTN